MYGAGMMPMRSVSSANVSGAHLKQSHTGAGSSTVTAKIFSFTRNVRSWPQLIFSVACGKDKHSSRTHSTFIGSPHLALWQVASGGERSVPHAPGVLGKEAASG